MRFWASEQPNKTVSRPLHPLKTTAWCAISAVGIIGPVFLHETVNADRYRTNILDFFITKLEQHEIDQESAFFQQDGARPHTANRNLDFLNHQFRERVLSNRYPERFNEGHHWPPYSPDFNPCDFFLWGFLKDRVYQNNPKTIQQLEGNITREQWLSGRGGHRPPLLSQQSAKSAKLRPVGKFIEIDEKKKITKSKK